MPPVVKVAEQPKPLDGNVLRPVPGPEVTSGMVKAGLLRERPLSEAASV